MDAHASHRMTRIQWPEFIDEAADIVRHGLAESGDEVSVHEAHRMIFDADSVFAERFRSQENFRGLLERARERQIVDGEGKRLGAGFGAEGEIAG